MKRMLKNVVFTIVALAAGTAAADWNDDFCPIVGVDYKWIHTGARSGAFGTLFPRSHHGASVYLGSRFSENFGLELGYDWLSRKSRTATFPAGTTFVLPTGSIRATAPVTVTGTNRVSQWRLDLNGYLPVGCEGFDLIGSIGIGSARSRVSFASTTPVAPGVFVPTTVSNTSKNNTVWRLGVGAQYMFNCNIGARALWRWEGVGRKYYDFLTGSTRRGRNVHGLTAGLFFRF